jgi:hypothetical protein
MCLEFYNQTNINEMRISWIDFEKNEMVGQVEFGSRAETWAMKRRKTFVTIKIFI